MTIVFAVVVTAPAINEMNERPKINKSQYNKEQKAVAFQLYRDPRQINRSNESIDCLEFSYLGQDTAKSFITWNMIFGKEMDGEKLAQRDNFIVMT